MSVTRSAGKSANNKTINHKKPPKAQPKRAKRAKKMTFGTLGKTLTQKMWEMKGIKAKIIEDKLKQGRGLSPTELKELARAKKVQDDAIIHIKK